VPGKEISTAPGFWQSNVLQPLGLRAPTTRDDWLRGVSEFLGAPVDGPAYALSQWAGVKGLQDPTLGYGETWRPAPSVPFGSTYWRQLMENPPFTADQALQALLRPKL
jgi:hypothetical protein